MPLTAHKLEAADLLDHGTFALRRELDQLQHRSQRLVAEQPAGDARPQWVVRRDQRAGVTVAPRR